MISRRGGGDGRESEFSAIGGGWLYLDTTKNHSRRWRSMPEYGNRAKARRYQRKQAGAAR